MSTWTKYLSFRESIDYSFDILRIQVTACITSVVVKSSSSSHISAFRAIIILQYSQCIVYSVDLDAVLRNEILSSKKDDKEYCNHVD